MHDAVLYPILAKLQNVKQTGENQWMASCSAHSDNRQSLAVSVGNTGKVVLKCHAGCDLPDILRTIPAEYGDLFPRVDPSSLPSSQYVASSPSPSASSKGNDSKSADRGRIVATYDYQAPDKSVLFQVVRFDPKDFKQRRPDPDRAGRYLWNMQGITRVLYRLPEILASAPSDIIYLVEGEKDADRLTKCGLIATTVPGGAGKWADTYSETIRGRHVVLIPDMDRPHPQTGRRPGLDHVVRVANALLGIAATVRVLELPNDAATFPPIPGNANSGPLVPKWDVSDWLDRGGTRAQFMAAVNAAPLWQRQAVPGDTDHADTKPNEAEDDPHRLATIYLERFKHPDCLTLRFWRDGFHRWNGRAYVAVPIAELKAEIAAACKAEFDRKNALKIKNWVPKEKDELPPRAIKVTSALVGNVILALQGLTLLPSTVEQPTWIDLPAGSPFTKRPARDFIALENGILDVMRVLRDDDAVPAADSSAADSSAADSSAVVPAIPGLLPHSPRWFSPVALDFPYSPTATCPRWDAFIGRNLDYDAEKADMLQEWFGYCLTVDTSYQRFLFLEGEGSNGKSVICSALTAVLGIDNVSHVSLEMFAKDFVLTQTLGKLANIAAEVGEIDKMAEGYLKSFTAGDRMTFNRKNQSLIEAAPTARLVLSANNRPRFSDRSEGIWRRMLILPLTVTITPDERVYGMDKTEWWHDQGELPGLLNWALRGLYRLWENRAFTIPTASREALDDYKEEANPARRFLLECYREHPEGETTMEAVYAHYTEWCKQNGNKPLASNLLGKEIVRVFKTAKRGKVKDMSNPWSVQRKNGYHGISISGEFVLPQQKSETQNNPDNPDKSGRFEFNAN
jgi:P4 family phage/plasmid primase-like protien